ncbi:MAG: glycosyltransferase [Lachnospiraceae bacterium]|nr:glycosyltransferase [Lachnospiraceae bacterium]
MNNSESTEYIGKVALDLSKYSGKDLYCDGEVEDELLEIVKTHKQEEYPSVIAKRLQWPILYHLSDLRENIVSWLRLKPGAKILEIGAGCGAISGALLKKAGRLDCVELSKKRSLINAYRHQDAENMCIHVGNFEDIEPELDTDYDAVFLIGVFEYAASYIHDEDPYGSFLKIIRKHARKDGIVVIAIENRLGMKYFGGAREDHLGEFFKGIEDYPDGGVVRTFSRPALEKLLKAEGVEDYHFYYPYPDYKFMMSLYSDERLPREGELNTNKLKLDRDRMELFDEGKAYDSLLRDGLFPVFSNSYLLVLGAGPDVVYSKYSNDRDDIYSIRTDMVKRAEGVCVEKYPAKPEAKEHIQKISSLYKVLSEKFKESGLKICPVSPTEDNEGIRFPFIEGTTMDELLSRAVRKNDDDKIKELLTAYGQFQRENCKGTISDPDMQLSNLIYGNGGWTLIDYEWAGEERGELIYNTVRGIYLFKEYNACGDMLDIDKVRDAIPYFPDSFDMQLLWKTEREFQKSVTGSRHALGELNELLGNGVINVIKEDTHTDEGETAPEVRAKSKFKQKLQAGWHDKAIDDYFKELEKQKDPYPYKPGATTEVRIRKLGRRCTLIPYSEACFDNLKGAGEFVVFAADGGKLELDAAGIIETRFDRNPECSWLYADEDVLCRDGFCRYPYYKPDWSVDTLLSYFYIGGLFAVRRDAIAMAITKIQEDVLKEKGSMFIYALCIWLANNGAPVHINAKPLFHEVYESIDNVGNMMIADPLWAGDEFSNIKGSFFTHYRIEGRHAKEDDGCIYPVYIQNDAKVSIIIPTKDHPEMFKNCVHSIRELSTYKNPEIIAIDNGSVGLNKERYEKLTAEYDVRYLYNKRDFNFAAMCNTGAKEAKGNVLIFLNDDTQVLCPEWIERMAGHAMIPGIGAVGCKLLYPGDDRKIQHCGVSNIGGGPIHRLQGLSDAYSYDRGRNRGVRNVLAVTAACLAITRENFDTMGGFYEGLPVAYNDVDLCMRLHKAGLRNVIRNDVRLIHYESASRGDDRDDEEKIKRLHAELLKLYERNPDYIAYDPYEHERLSDESNVYEEARPCERKKIPVTTQLQLIKDKKSFAPVNEALIIKIDEMEKEPGADVIGIDLHVHVRDWDNADYHYYAYLEGGGRKFVLPVKRRYRADVERTYRYQTNVALSGLTARIAKDALPAGEYSLWVEARSRISRQRLFNKAKQTLKVD